MSFDLHFFREDHSLPTIAELKEYFAASGLFKTTDTEDGRVQFWYRNEATGVYCDFSYSPLDAAELEGSGSGGLSFNLNYVRPSFFAYETMPLVEAFCQRFNLNVEDPQEQTVGPAETSRLIRSWRAQNQQAMGAVLKVRKEEEIELHYLPEAEATAWWQYMSIRQTIENALDEDVFVPSLMILLGPTQQLFTMMIWQTDVPQFFPRCNYVFVHREKKRMFGTKVETGLVAYDSVIVALGALLDDYDLGGSTIKYLKPDKTARVAQVVQTLKLNPIDLGQHTEIASDRFHDVALSMADPESQES